MNFVEAIKSVFSKYATFKGRARRSEYWYFVLFCVLLSIGVTIVELTMGSVGAIVSMVCQLAIIIPSLAVQVRRLHDVGKSGWHVLINTILAVISVTLMFMGVGLENIDNPENADPALMNMPMLASGLGLFLVGFIYSIYILVQMFINSQPEENQYGPNPKADEDELVTDEETEL